MRALWTPSPDRIAACGHDQVRQPRWPTQPVRTCQIRKRCSSFRSITRANSGLRYGISPVSSARRGSARSCRAPTCGRPGSFPDADLECRRDLVGPRRRRRRHCCSRAKTGSGRRQPSRSCVATWPPLPTACSTPVSMSVMSWPAWLPNCPAAYVTALAAAAIGAVYTSTSPDFGTAGVLDRFGQVAPKVLVAADAYLYGGQRHDCLSRLREIGAGLPSVQRVVVVPFVGDDPDLSGIANASTWADFAAADRPSPFRFVGCRSTRRCRFCSRRARPECRSAWCIEPAESCSPI